MRTISVFFIFTGIMIAMIGVVVMIAVLTGVGENQPDEIHTAGLTISNCCGDNVTVEIYVLGEHRWDQINLWIDNGTQKDLTIEWDGKLVNVLIIYSYQDEEKTFKFLTKPQEWRTIILV